MLFRSVFNSLEDCEVKTEEVAYYVRLARRSSAAAFAPIFKAVIN